jgi:hypothetical protein
VGNCEAAIRALYIPVFRDSSDPLVFLSFFVKPVHILVLRYSVFHARGEGEATSEGQLHGGGGLNEFLVPKCPSVLRFSSSFVVASAAETFRLWERICRSSEAAVKLYRLDKSSTFRNGRSVGRIEH